MVVSSFTICHILSPTAGFETFLCIFRDCRRDGQFGNDLFSRVRNVPTKIEMYLFESSLAIIPAVARFSGMLLS